MSPGTAAESSTGGMQTKDVASEPSISRRFSTALGWLTASSAVTQVLSLSGTVMAGRFLGTEGLGLVFLLQTTLGAAVALGGLGLAQTASRFASDLQEDGEGKVTSILKFTERGAWLSGGICSLVLLLSADTIATLVFKRPDFRQTVQWGSLLGLLMLVDTYYRNLLVGLHAMRRYAGATTLGSVATLSATLLGAAFAQVPGYIGGWILAAGAQAALLTRGAHRSLAEVNLKLTTSRPERLPRHELLHYAVPAYAASLCLAPAHWLTQAMLSAQSGGLAAITVLGIALQWYAIILMVPSLAGRVALPIVTRLRSQGQRDLTRRFLLVSTGVNLLISLPAALALWMLGDPILSLYGVKAAGGAAAMGLAGLAAVLTAVQAPVGNLIAAGKSMWPATVLNVVWALTFVGLSHHWLGQGSCGVLSALCVAYGTMLSWTIGITISQLKNS